ncbi:DUF4367 domain-containing protein [Bacillus sp. AK031]
MRKIFFLLIAVSFILSACSINSNGENLVTYDNSQLSSDLEKEGIDPKLPTGFPIAITEYELFKPPHQTSRYETNLIGENGEIFTIIVHSTTVSYEGEFENQEEVTINGNEGFYTENEVTGPSLHWTDGDYHYILDYQTIGLETAVNKDTMMAIADSFE